MNKYSIKDFEKQFPDDDACLEWIKNYLYPDGIYCKTCEMVTPHSKLSNIPVYSCNRCGRHIHPMAGTIFQDTRTPLKSWFYAMFLMSATKCGISAKQLERELGVTYKTAYRIFKQIRSLMQDTEQQVCGEIEVDETYIGGRTRGNDKLRNKTAVLGIVQRKGAMFSKKVRNVKSSTIIPIIKDKVLKYSLVYTDELPTYNKLDENHYFHHKVDHHKKEYVKGKAHTNTLESFWGNMKRGIDGVHHYVSKKHLQMYVDEYVFRYNHRGDDKPIFLTVLERI